MAPKAGDLRAAALVLGTLVAGIVLRLALALGPLPEIVELRRLPEETIVIVVALPLHLVGRNGMHRYDNQDHAMMTAMLTVENILAGERLYDTWCVNEDAEYHEEIKLRESLLVGFFLAGLVIHGGLQAWWIAPVLGTITTAWAPLAPVSRTCSIT